MADKKKKVNWQDKYKRALADYQNLTKLKAKEQVDLVKFANSNLLQDLLPVYSHLKLSLQHAPAENNSWLEGVQYVVKQFKTVLESKGVQEVLTENQIFDPQTMEAVEEIDAEDQSLDQKIAKELAPGYVLHERTIVPARVAVYRYQE